MKRWALLPGALLVVSTLVLVACGTPKSTSTPEPGQSELANPASVYCEEQGGKLDIRTDSQGGQYGVCIFDDGSECEEWAFFRGECQPGQMDRAPGGAEASPQTVTLENDGGTIALEPGDRFLLKLDEAYDWTVTVADQTILSRVVNVTVVRGAQGLYEAHQTGSTTLTAAGEPICRQSQPPCAMPSRLFEVRVEVQ
jgi:putative hemolysin